MSIKGDALLYMMHFPTEKNMGYGGAIMTNTVKYWRDGRWIIGASASKRSNPLQIRFTNENAENFINSVNKLFQTRFVYYE